jgi:hypothetical protein
LGHLYFLLGLGAFALLGLLVGLYKRWAPRYRLPYVASPVLFNVAQIAFLAVLERAVGRDYRVYGRVRVADIVAPRRRLDRRTRRRAWDRLDGRRFDFLVCRADTGAIACAVNLAPRSRLRRGVARDALDRICAAAGLPLVRFRESETYATAQIREQVMAAIQAAAKASVDAVSVLAEPADDLDDLDDLGEILVADDRRAASARTRLPLRRPIAAVPDRSTQIRPVPIKPEAAKPAPATQPVEPPRLEPRLTGGGDIDLGPSFRIDGDLDEEDHPQARRNRV